MIYMDANNTNITIYKQLNKLIMMVLRIPTIFFVAKNRLPNIYSIPNNTASDKQYILEALFKILL